MKKLKRVILYLRVSTEQQYDDGFSIPEQKERLLAYCKAHGWLVVAIYIDPGHSGSHLQRPGIQALIEAVEQDKADIVLVYKLDRLSRSQKDTLYLIEDIFLANNTDFVSMQEALDTTTPFGRAMVGILAVFAQLERENTKERTMMGRAGRAKEGLWHGGGTHPIGYDYIDGELVVNKEEARQIKMVYEMFLQGHTVTDISIKMNGYTTKHGDWSNIQTVAQVLDNELYTGTVHFLNVKSKNAHTAIVSDMMYKRVQLIRERNKKDNFQDKDSKHLLTGLVFCARCGARYFVNKNPNGNYFYSCYSRVKKNKKMIKEPSCKNCNYPKALLEEKIEHIVSEFIKDPQKFDELIKKSRALKKDSATEKEMKLADNIRGEIDSIENEINRLMDLYQHDQLPVETIAEKIDSLHRRKVGLVELVSETDTKPNKDFYVEAARLLIRGMNGEDWYSFATSRKRHILRQLIDRIEIDEDINIVWSW